MKRFAHTLSEVLIALAVIGILGGVTIPMINKYKPDVNKVKFLKNYDAIVKVNKHLMYNTNIYNRIDEIYSYEEFPFAHTHNLLRGNNTINGDSRKYCQLLSDYLSEGISETCSENFSNDINGDPHFTTKDGTDYWVYTSKNDNGDGTGTYRSNIFIDIDGNKEGTANCRYDAEACPNPDRFLIAVAPNGGIYVDDAMGQNYLNRRANFRLNKNDAELQLVSPDDNKFEYSLRLLSCPDGQVLQPNGRCGCPEGQILNLLDGTCTTPPPICENNQVLIDGFCINLIKPCPIFGQKRQPDGNCACPEGQVVVGQACATPEPECPPALLQPDGSCGKNQPPIDLCESTCPNCKISYMGAKTICTECGRHLVVSAVCYEDEPVDTGGSGCPACIWNELYGRDCSLCLQNKVHCSMYCEDALNIPMANVHTCSSYKK